MSGIFGKLFTSPVYGTDESLKLELVALSSQELVEQKLKKHIKRKFTEEELKNAIANLSQVERVKESYLDSAIIKRKQELISKKNIELQRSSISGTVDYEIKVKLLITDLYQSMREMVTPLLHTVDINTKYGIFHSALLIGEWMFDWDDSELCIPKKLSSELALFVVDIGTISILHQVDEVIDKIAKIIVKWNTKFEYSMIPGKTKQHKGNCQEFVEDILNSINIKPKFEGATALFLEKMRTQGKSEMVYETKDPELIKKFGFEKKVFTTHEELDKFMIETERVFEDFELTHKQDYELLKCFDRAFWLRYYKTKKDEFCPHKEGSNVRCPFGDPEITQSFYKN